jgi:hypothetical protein
VIWRSILLRQIESLAVAVHLVETNHGYTAVPLVRPACEELLWLRYITNLAPADRKSLIECLIATGLLKDVEAQEGEVGEEEMTAMGLGEALSGFRAAAPSNRQKLKALGRRLGWPERAVRNGEVPSAWFVATATGSEQMYRFLYYASSRYVHFSPVELARRGWGQPGRLEISSNVYEPIWALFSLAWSARLLGWTLNASLDQIAAEKLPEPPHEMLQQAFELIANVPLMPLITSDELDWPRRTLPDADGDEPVS